MSDLPPPTGTPVAGGPPGDPWAEQARRHGVHRAQRSARRRRRALRGGAAVIVVLLAGAAAVAGRLLGDGTDQEPLASMAPVADPLEPPRTTEQISAAEAAAVDEVWLLDRGDGTYDWGALVSSASDVLRRDLDVSVALLDVDGVEVITEQVRIAQLAPDGHAVIGGVVRVDGAAPARIEVTATLGTAAPEAVAALVAVSDPRRINSGQLDRDDRLLGAAEVIEGDVAAVRVAALWRDDAGKVVASVIKVIEVRGAETATEFSLRLPRTVVPAGEPDDVVANVAVLN